MKISLAVTLLILALGAVIGWHDSQQLAALRTRRGHLIAAAAEPGVDLTDQAAPGRSTKHPRVDRAASARQLAAGFIAFGKEREAFEKTAGEPRDAAMQKEMNRRMTDFRERMMSMDPAQLTALIEEVRADKDLTAETRRRLVAVAVLALANDHPQAVLALLTGSPGFAKDDLSGGWVMSSSLARWAKDDPLAALAWVRDNAEKHPDIVSDNAKRGMLSGVAVQDPKLAFRLIGELGLRDSNDTLQNIVGAAQTRDEKLATLAALREHLATVTDEKTRDEAAAGSLTVLANGFVQEGFAAASQWLATAKLAPAELAGVAGGLNYDPANSGETGQWIEWLGTAIVPDKSADRIQYLVASWTRDDYQAAGQWLAATADGPAKNTAIRSYAATIARYEPETAAQWALTLPAGEARDSTLKTIHRNWPDNDPVGAAAFAKTHGIK